MGRAEARGRVLPAPSAPGARPLAGRLGVHVVVAAVCTLYAVALGKNPLVCEPWLPFAPPLLVVLSLAGGAVVAAGTVVLGRRAIQRFAWGRVLFEDLRAPVRLAGDGTLLVLAAAGGIAEELLFRGVLVPPLGILVSSALFGLLHQARGQARWAWALWAFGLAVALAVLFRATGSLVGAMLAHAAINFENLRFLRDTDLGPERRRSALGGLLR